MIYKYIYKFELARGSHLFSFIDRKVVKKIKFFLSSTVKINLKHYLMIRKMDLFLSSPPERISIPESVDL